jgi:hypothetical protein
MIPNSGSGLILELLNRAFLKQTTESHIQWTANKILFMPIHPSRFVSDRQACS